MNSRYFLILIVFTLCLTPINGQEGHPGWWWDSKHTDFIVEGTLIYDASKYYEINPVGIEERKGKYFCIPGKIRINRVLFINKDSRHLESYQQYLKHMEKDYPVLITAFRRTGFHGSSHLEPTLGLDIPKETTIFNLSQVYLFPFGDLKLESVVPRGNINEVMELIGKRSNNLLTK